MGTEKCCQRPGKSMNLISRICAPFSFTILRTSAGFISFFPPYQSADSSTGAIAVKDFRGDVFDLDACVESVYDGLAVQAMEIALDTSFGKGRWRSQGEEISDPGCCRASRSRSASR